MDAQALDYSELLRRARVDANAFGVFYRRHARGVYRCTGRLHGTPILRTRGGRIKPVPLPVAGDDRPAQNVLPIFSGFMPAGDTAA